jgi:hypothetical protein
MPTVRRQAEIALVRDTAVQKLRDLTIAVAVAAAAGVALIAWMSAATIPGTADASGQTVNTADDGSGQPPATSDDGFNQGQPGAISSGPGIAVTGGSH